MSAPYFSVIMPVYGVEKYLRDTLDSVLRQTFADFELILVDDCSKDGSGKICDEVAASDGRVRVIHKEKNGGASSARNLGTKSASGKYWIPTIKLTAIYLKKCIRLRVTLLPRL